MDLELLKRPEYELRVVADLTVELVRLRQNECKHLCIENIGPEIFGKLLQELYHPPMLLRNPEDLLRDPNHQPLTADSAAVEQK